jgi:hypothetical protein
MAWMLFALRAALHAGCPTDEGVRETSRARTRVWDRTTEGENRSRHLPISLLVRLISSTVQR